MITVTSLVFAGVLANPGATSTHEPVVFPDSTVIAYAGKEKEHPCQPYEECGGSSGQYGTPVERVQKEEAERKKSAKGAAEKKEAEAKARKEAAKKAATEANGKN